MKVVEHQNYERNATEEEIKLTIDFVEKLTSEERKNIIGGLYVDKETFSPYVIINNIRFDIEAMQDSKTKKG